MRADICDPDDTDSFGRFLQVRKELGAEFEGGGWGIGISMYRVAVAGAVLTIINDSLSVGIEGPDGLVSAILATLAGLAP
jgi:hypothetical protein